MTPCENKAGATSPAPSNEWARELVTAGYALIPYDRGKKGPRGKSAAGWNLPENVIRSEADFDRRVNGTALNFGIAHAFCAQPTCAIDIDDMAAARIWFKERDVDLDELFNAPDAVTINSGSDGHGKLVFRLPPGHEPLPQKKHRPAGAEHDVADFRCATSGGLTVQDAAPGSLHPSGRTYQWGGKGDWRLPPVIPDALLKIWKDLLGDTPSVVQQDLGEWEPVDLDDYPEISPETRLLIEEGVPDGQRSGALYRVVPELHRTGMSPRTITCVLCDRRHGISDKAWASRSTQRAAMKWQSKDVNRILGKVKDGIISTPFSDLDAEPGDVREIANAPLQKPSVGLPHDLCEPPGLVGELARHITATAWVPQPIYSLVSALATFGIASQNVYEVGPWKTRLNEFLLLVGLSTSGKDIALRMPVKALKEARVDLRMIASSATSDTALLRHLASSGGKTALVVDEIGHLLAASRESGQSHLASLVAELLRLYTSSSDVYTGKCFADPTKNVPPIREPFLSLLGATTPQKLMEGIQSGNVKDGLLNRILPFFNDDFGTKRKAGELSHDPVPSEIVDRLAHLNGTADLFAPIAKNGTDAGGNTLPIAVDDDVLPIADELDQTWRMRVVEDPEHGELWGRGFEHVLKLSGIVALGGPDAGRYRVTREIFNWATKVVEHVIRTTIDQLIRYHADSPFEANVKKVLAMIRDPARYASDQAYAKYCKAGYMPRSKILKHLKSLPEPELKQILARLIETDQIQKCKVAGGSGKEVECYRACDESACAA